MRRLYSRDRPGIKLSFVDPTDFYIYSTRFKSFEDLYNYVVTRRELMGHPAISNLDFLVEAFIAEDPENEKYSYEDETAQPPATLSEYFQGAKLLGTLLAHRLIGRDVTVKGGLADKRAAVCAACIYNTKKAQSQGAIIEVGQRLLGVLIGSAHKTAFDEFLGMCVKCGCKLKDKVHVKSAIVKESLRRKPHVYKSLPVEMKTTIDRQIMTCWQRDEKLMSD